MGSMFTSLYEEEEIVVPHDNNNNNEEENKYSVNPGIGEVDQETEEVKHKVKKNNWLKKIQMKRTVIKHFLGYEGKVQYYKKDGFWWNQGLIIIRKEEGNSTFAAKCHLVHDKQHGWIVSVDETQWNPPQNENKMQSVTESQFSWNIIKALSAVQTVSQKYGAWSLFFNNCQHFRDNIVIEMLKNGPLIFDGPFNGNCINNWDDFFQALTEYQLQTFVDTCG